MLTVGDLMTTGLLAAHPSDALDAVEADMRAAQIRHMPVTDEHQQLVGILSDRDVIRGQRRRRNKTVGDVMTRDLVTVTPETAAYDAVGLLIENRIGSLPVVEGHRLIGIVTETDFLGVARDLLLAHAKRGQGLRAHG